MNGNAVVTTVFSKAMGRLIIEDMTMIAQKLAVGLNREGSSVLANIEVILSSSDVSKA